MHRYTLQVNDSGAWRNVLDISLDDPRMARLIDAVGAIMQLAPDIKFSLRRCDQRRHWINVDPDTGLAFLRPELDED